MEMKRLKQQIHYDQAYRIANISRQYSKYKDELPSSQQFEVVLNISLLQTLLTLWDEVMKSRNHAFDKNIFLDRYDNSDLLDLLKGSMVLKHQH